jgi:hypothetical protein
MSARASIAEIVNVVVRTEPPSPQTAPHPHRAVGSLWNKLSTASYRVINACASGGEYSR